MEILIKSMSLKLNKLMNSPFQGSEKTGYIKNEGISRDVIENKWRKYFR